MKYSEHVTKLEKGKFKIADWSAKYTHAKTARATWDKQAQDGWDIRNNNLPLNKDIANLDEYKDKWYIDNWVHKSNKFLISTLVGGDVFLDMQSVDGEDTPSMILMENEVNFAFDKFEFIQGMPEVIADRLYTGYGVSRMHWDAERIDQYWKTGKPIFEHIDSRKVWIDPATKDKFFNDRRYQFHLESFGVKTFKQDYPQYWKMVQEATPNMNYGDDPNQKKTIDVVNCQYKKTLIMEKVEVTDTDSGQSWMFTIEEYNDFLKDNKLPEAVVVSKPIKIKEDVIYMALFIPNSKIVLEQPQFIGKQWSYQFFPGLKQNNSAYPFGTAYYVKDLLEISIIIMTILTIQTTKTNKPMPTVEEGALANEEDFFQNHWKQDFVPVVNEEWRLAHPGVDPISWKVPPINANIPIALQNMLTESQKSFMGAIDSMRGESTYSGQSGVAVAQLQSAGSTYLKVDELEWHSYLRSVGDSLKELIVLYRNYPHKILGVNDEGERGMIEVATNAQNQLEADMYYCQPTVETNPELVKQANQDKVMALYEAGLMPGMNVLKSHDVKNPERTYNEAKQEQGILSLIEAMKEDPEYMEQIQADLKQREEDKGTK